jgi:UDP:flavonoid glycosyltransferase YjiC (YdhE family)
MRFTVVTYGSEGDTRPLVALCRGLMDAHHEVQLFTEQSTVGSGRALGVPVAALAGELQSILPMDDPSRELSRWAVLKTFTQGLRLVNENTASWMRSVSEHARTSDAILFAGLASLTGRTVAQALHKPAINLCLQPTSATREFPSPILPPMRLPAWVNRLSYCVSPNALIALLYGKATRTARDEIFGKGKRGNFAGEFPILYGFSSHLVKRPGDWPESHLISGHWPLPPGDWQAPNELLEFLSAGPAPIYVGFGAMSSIIRRKALSEITSAIAGRRALFYPGWSSAAMLPDNFFVIDNIPHSWLFPRTSVVIHHAGAGTTHSAARAGVPSIALPVAVDQFYWAGRLACAGVAPKYIRAAKIDAKSLAEMLEFTAQDGVRERAKALGAAMAEEHGVRRAVAAIEALIGTAGAGTAGA